MDIAVLLLGLVLIVHATLVSVWVDRKVTKALKEVKDLATRLSREGDDLIRVIKELGKHLHGEEDVFHAKVLRRLSTIEKTLNIPKEKKISLISVPER